MPIVFTDPFENQASPELKAKVEHAMTCFPEFQSRKVIVGVVHSSAVHGDADSRNMFIRLNLEEPKRGPSHYTIGHELTHLLQSRGMKAVPGGEVQCDIWTLARSSLFLDEKPAYLWPVQCNRRAWQQYAEAVRELCMRAIEVRRTNRRYIEWLSRTLNNYWEAPIDLSLLNGW